MILKTTRPVLAVFGGLFVIGLASAQSLQPAKRNDCFPFEKLTPELRVKAESILLDLLDREGLYTLVGIKPMSSGFVSLRLNVDEPDLKALSEMKTILATFRVGQEIGAGLQPFAAVYEGSRFCEGFLFHRTSFRQVIEKYPLLFGSFGVTPESEPGEVLLSFDSDSGPKRNRYRAYGHLFGYPEYAVNFFAEGTPTGPDGKLAPRDFVAIPTFKLATGAFTYAVPKGHVQTSVDTELRDRALPVLAYYKTLREKYIGDGKPGVVKMVRDWMDDGRGRLSSAAALKKVK